MPRLGDCKCVGCGCTDSCACINDVTGEPCFWLRLDRAAKTGVCSECAHLVSAWDAGAYGDDGRTSKREKA